jgi:hypothetical protein
MKKLAIALGLLGFSVVPASAHHYRHSYHHHYTNTNRFEWVSSYRPEKSWQFPSGGDWFATTVKQKPTPHHPKPIRPRPQNDEDYQEFAVTTHLGGRPRAWCGWEMRQLVGSDPGVDYNLARNWAHWGHPSGPQIGAVVVWPHHVGKIVGDNCPAGQKEVLSGNDGNRVRTRCLSVSRAIAFRQG